MTDVHQPSARDRFGGVKIGCAFLGFAAAYGVTVIITGLATSVAVAAGQPIVLPTGLQDLYGRIDPQPTQVVQVVAYVIGLAAVLIAYALGGYVAGRMARFDGARQGVAVWVWGLVVTILTLVLSSLLVTGEVGYLVRQLGGVPPVLGLVTLLVLATQLVGAVLGGLAGMRFHRRVDRAETVPGGPVASGG